MIDFSFNLVMLRAPRKGFLVIKGITCSAADIPSARADSKAGSP